MKNKRLFPKIKPHMRRFKRKFKRTRSKKPLSPRYKEVREMKDSGMTYQEIGDKYGISRQRVHQMLKRLEQS